MGTSVKISELEFSDGTRVAVGDCSMVVFVGPNNGGKTASLKAILSKLETSDAPSPVVRSLKLEKVGTPAEVVKWIEEGSKVWQPLANHEPRYDADQRSIHKHQIAQGWQTHTHSLGALTKWMCLMLSTEARLAMCSPPPAISLTADVPTNPIHLMQRDDTLELRLSDLFAKAFGAELIVHRNAGSQVPIYVGERPVPDGTNGEDRASLSFARKIELLTPLHSQGDGMRAYAGLLMSATAGREPVLLIDEPEAFLHPPQARLLGQFLVRDTAPGKQVFIATHSSNLLNGLLGAGDRQVKVVRIRRDGAVNAVRALDNTMIRALWKDSLLRHSNILDGLFHDGVVVCESDSDCRFYSAVATDSDAEHRPDIMFTHCGGKQRFGVVVSALIALDVPVRVVADFDLLGSEPELKAVVNALKGDFARFEANWKIVHRAIGKLKPELKTADVRTRMNSLLAGITSEALPVVARDQIRDIVKIPSGWESAKAQGRAAIPTGAETQALDRLLEELRAIGLHIVEVGEMEGFARSIGGHGPRWVEAALQRPIGTDPEFASAREFVGRLIGSFAAPPVRQDSASEANSTDSAIASGTNAA